MSDCRVMWLSRLGCGVRGAAGGRERELVGIDQHLAAGECGRDEMTGENFCCYNLLPCCRFLCKPVSPCLEHAHHTCCLEQQPAAPRTS